LETADYLGAKGVKVTLVEMQDHVGEALDPLPRTMLLKRLAGQGAEIHVGTEIEGFAPGEAMARKSGKVLALPAETVVMAVGVRPDRSLAEALADEELDLRIVGDAVSPRGIGDAIWEAHQVAARV